MRLDCTSSATLNVCSSCFQSVVPVIVSVAESRTSTVFGNIDLERQGVPGIGFDPRRDGILLACQQADVGALPSRGSHDVGTDVAQ